MDTMERYKIRKSIEDVIAILDSAPMNRDLIPETNIVQLTNRAPIAHLAIERGLKALIINAGKSADQIHSLDRLYRALTECDEEAANFLAKAFEDSVTLFRFKVNAKGFGHLKSLEAYFAKVGKDKDFEALRYWAIGESSKGESPIPYIAPSIHRELLCALCCLFFPIRRETVLDRIEQAVFEAMTNTSRLMYNTRDDPKKRAVDWYLNWLLNEHSTRCRALEEAVRQNFTIKDDDEFIGQILRDACADLQRSKDPAVQYYMYRLTYLPKGSQQRDPDAIPKVQWLNHIESDGEVKTPVGTTLGFIEKRADGAWEIIPMEDGLVRVSDVAETLADAKAYLVSRLTNQVVVSVNGVSKRLRIVSERNSFPLPEITGETGDSESLNSWTQVYKLEFWDGDHGLSSGDGVVLELHSEEYTSVLILEGMVKGVKKQMVSIAGKEVLT